MSGTKRCHVRVTGTVQGVGFRPHVHRLATERGLTGFVGNDDRGVFIEIEGDGATISEFLQELEHAPPPLAAIDGVETTVRTPAGETTFRVIESRDGGNRDVQVSADAATCNACLAEIHDPDDRRHGYAFTNCTNCGPRYTIVRDVPYDRPLTTMAGFEMCTACRSEYTDPTDRRFHAQPTCCPRCGPQLTLDGDPSTQPWGRLADLLRDGRLVGVKGIGGYHVAALAEHEDAVATLRRRKQRDQKPFALMVADLDQARRLCLVDGDEARLLDGVARPIVLLRRRRDALVAPSVAPGNRHLGLMLPYTPLHHLLLDALAAPIVLTSGNIANEPMAHRDDDAQQQLTPVVDALLAHDRPIHVRVDDSVARMMRGAPVLLRRSRGYAPRPIRLPVPCRRHVLAVGAEQKNTVCLARDDHAFLSPHIGDLDNLPTLQAFREATVHLGRLFAVTPEIVAHDLHPEYLSTKYAMELEDATLVGVQHHHAHIASCLVDNGRTDRVVGVAFDGTGYGTDATIWGGEFLVADLTGFVRGAHLSPVPMPGGAAAIREPWRMAASHLDVAFDGDVPRDLGVVTRNADRFDRVVAVAHGTINTPPTSSMGRLFDAVAAIIGIRDVTTYEGQAAIALEHAADPSSCETYPVDLVLGTVDALQVDAGALVRRVCEDMMRGTDVAAIAARFHSWVCDVVVGMASTLAEEHAVHTVALSGGVFQNALLVERVVPDLRRAGLEVLTHRQVPPNDGGIALGQAAIASAALR